MTLAVLAVLTALFVWWFATGAILYANGLDPWMAPWTAAFATLVLAASLTGLHLTSADATPFGAYIAFLCAIGVWGWHELMFLTGRITGPRTTPAPGPGATVSRLRAAIEVVIYHEVALALTLALVAVLALGDGNPVGFLTFAALWAMRLSAKVNLYLGVRNLSEEFLPPRLAYLASYFRSAPTNPLLPASVLIGTAATVAVAALAVHEGSDFAITAGALVATLIALAVVEHVFMVVPFDATRLWRSFAARRSPRQAPPPNLPRTRRCPLKLPPERDDGLRSLL